jgi:hypothetical protein
MTRFLLNILLVIGCVFGASRRVQLAANLGKLGRELGKAIWQDEGSYRILNKGQGSMLTKAFSPASLGQDEGSHRVLNREAGSMLTRAFSPAIVEPKISAHYIVNKMRGTNGSPTQST